MARTASTVFGFERVFPECGHSTAEFCLLLDLCVIGPCVEHIAFLRWSTSEMPCYFASAIFSIRTAQALNSGIAATGSRALLVSDVCCTFHVVERDEDNTFLDVLCDPCTNLDLSSAGDGLDHLLVLDTECLCILRVDLDPAGWLLALETLRAAGHGTGVPLPDAAPGGQDERVVLVRDFCRGFPLDRGEDAQSVRVGELLLVQDRCSRVLAVGQGQWSASGFSSRA